MSRKSWIRPATRVAIYFRDGWRCVYCGAGGHLSLDHVDPAGGNAPDNLVTACVPCNSSRKRRPMREWYAALRARGVDTKLVRLHLYRQRRRPLNRPLARFALRTWRHRRQRIADVAREIMELEL